MIRIELKQVGKSPRVVLEDFNRELFALQTELMNLGNNVHQAMILHIMANKKRPHVSHPHGSTGSESKMALEDSIQLETFNDPSMIGFGIGNIEFLNINSPHWYWINFGKAQSGRTTPPETTGQFIPGVPQPDPSAFRSGVLMPGMYPVIPQNKMPAMNYIEVGERELIAGINKIIEKLKRGF